MTLMTANHVIPRGVSGRPDRRSLAPTPVQPSALPYEIVRLRRAIFMLDFGARRAAAVAPFRAGAAAVAVLAPMACMFAGAGYPLAAMIEAAFAVVGLGLFVEATFRFSRIDRDEAEYERGEAERQKAIAAAKEAAAALILAPDPPAEADAPREIEDLISELQQAATAFELRRIEMREAA